MPVKTTTAPKKAAKSRGNLKPAEIKPLIMAARKAYDFQRDLGNTDDAQGFDAWRREQCLQAVNRPGITACNHDDFRPLLAHFQTLAGDDGSAFASHMKSGKPTDTAAPGDTHESRRQLAHTIAEILNAHIHLAETSVDVLLAEAIAELDIFQPGQPWETSPGPAAFRKLIERKNSIAAKAPLTVGYVVYLVRQKTRRPDLTLGKDWQASLAERCTAAQLVQIRNTIVNRIAAVEGLGSTKARNKSQASPKSILARQTKGDDRRW